MPFKPKPDNLKLSRLIQTNLTPGTHEIWLSICRRQNKSTHALLRQVVEEYCKEQMERRTQQGSVVYRTLGSR